MIFKTFGAVVEKMDHLIPNSFAREDKLRWLWVFDGKIRREIMETHEAGDERAGQGTAPCLDEAGDERAGQGTVPCLEGADSVYGQSLVVPEPYGMELYLAFLENTMDHYNGDTVRYNNSLDRLATLYREFFRRYNREHLPLGDKRKFW